MLQRVVDFIFPPQCGGCAKIGAGVCEGCLPRDAVVRFRLQSLDVVALGAYEGGLRRAVLALKSGRRDVAKAFALRLGGIAPRGAVLVPVPTTAGRRRQRGFDGCELMARRLCEQSSTTAAPHVVQIAGDRQRGRNRDARLAARGRFAWLGGDASGMQVTLLDDVVTTGSTLEDCAALLRSHGALVESAIVVARA